MTLRQAFVICTAITLTTAWWLWQTNGDTPEPPPEAAAVPVEPPTTLGPRVVLSDPPRALETPRASAQPVAAPVPRREPKEWPNPAVLSRTVFEAEATTPLDPFVEPAEAVDPERGRPLTVVVAP